MARSFAPSLHRSLDTKRPYPFAHVRKTGGIRVVDKFAATNANGSRQVSDSKSGRDASPSSPDASSATLYRRVLFPNALEPPPRILSTPGTEQLDDQLYNLLALICRGFITPWFGKITRDRSFFLEVTWIASHVFRKLEEKLAGSDEQEPIDVVRFLLESIPGVLERHIRDYRRAREMLGSGYASGASIPAGGTFTPLQEVFHSLQPHAAIRSSQVFATLDASIGEEKLPRYISADYVRALVDALLEELLPEEDYTAETERAVVREVIVGIILAGVFNKVSQPWFIHGLICKYLEPRRGFEKVGHQQQWRKAPEQPLLERVSLFCASLPLMFYKITALFTIASYIVVTSLATPFLDKTRARHVCRVPMKLVSTMVDARREGRQILGQLEWLISTSTTVFVFVLDK